MTAPHYAVEVRHRRLGIDRVELCATAEEAIARAKMMRADGFTTRVLQPPTAKPLFLFAYVLGQLSMRSDALNPASAQIARAAQAHAEMLA